ncbi:MAG: hypothetical protein ACFFCW_31285 [Candidatus Hodarchaeota archaeon]
MVILYIQLAIVALLIVLYISEYLKKRYFCIAIIFTALSILLNINLVEQLKSLHKLIPEQRKPLLSYSIDGMIYLGDEQRNKFSMEVKNLSIGEVKNITLYLLASFKEMKQYENLGEFEIGHLPSNGKWTPDSEFISKLINQRLRNIKPESLEKEVIKTIILSGRYEDVEGNVYDDWIKRSPVFSESIITYKKHGK